MSSRNHQQGGFGGFGGLGDIEEQIFGRGGLIGQVLGGQGHGPGGHFGGGGGFGGPGQGRPGPGGDRRRARRGDVRNAVLHLLRREPMNGYQLMQEIAQSSGGAWQPSSGAIYPALSQLEDEGLTEQTDVEGRRAYQLTAEGRAAADALPPQGWAGGQEPEDPWSDAPSGPGARRGRGGQARGSAHQGHRDRARSNGALWKSLGGAVMAAQAVSQAGDRELTAQAAELLDRSRRDLYRLLAEAEVAKDDESAAADYEDEVTDAEIIDED